MSVNVAGVHTTSDTNNHSLLKPIPPPPNPTAEQSYGTSPAATTPMQVTEEHSGVCHSATHIDQVLLEALPQVLNECCFTGEVLEQDKVLDPHPVTGGQSTLHGQPNAVGPCSLQPKQSKVGISMVSSTGH